MLDTRPVRGRLTTAIAAAAAASALATPGASAGPAAADTVWLCDPAAVPNPCHESNETTVQAPDGSSTTENPPFPRRPKIDCFYVYPTVSEDPGANADRSIDPEQVAIARYQAARFSTRCRVYAPMYRQVTLMGLNAPESQQVEAARLAYSDLIAAFRDYMRNRNRGRGFVLIGHSQGTFMLRHLIRQRIDPYGAARRKLVSAILLGGNVTVAADQPAGGDFSRIPACGSRRQLGCVIAYSTFNETPPSNSRYGRPTTRYAQAFGLPTGPGLEVLCTNPALLRGGPAELYSLVRTEPYPGVIGALILYMYGGEPPSAPTPWVRPADRYGGECVEEEGANVLMVSPIGSARRLNPSPDPSWGLHLADVNIALGNLVAVVGAQARAYLRRRG